MRRNAPPATFSESISPEDKGELLHEEGEDGKLHCRYQYPPIELTPLQVALVLEAYSGAMGSAEHYTTVAFKVAEDVVRLSRPDGKGGHEDRFIRITPTFTVNTCANPAL